MRVTVWVFFQTSAKWWHIWIIYTIVWTDDLEIYRCLEMAPRDSPKLCKSAFSQILHGVPWTVPLLSVWASQRVQSFVMMQRNYQFYSIMITKLMGLSLYVYFWPCVDYRKSKISLNLCTQFLSFKSLKCSDSPWKKNSSKKLAWKLDLWWLDENDHSWICNFIKLQISVFYCDLFILFAVYSEWTTIQG